MSPDAAGAVPEGAGAPDPAAALPRSRVAVLEDAVSVGALVLMAAIPITEALIRPVYPTGIPGSFMWVQHLTLWVAFLGAAVASRRGELLSLSAGPSMVSEVWRPRLLSLSGAVGVVVSVVLSYASVVLTRAEWQGGRELALGVPVWAAVAVMPVGFLLIAWRLWRRVPTRWGRGTAILGLAIPLLLHEGLTGWDLTGYGIEWPLLALILIAAAFGAPIFVALGGAAAVLLWSNWDPVSAIPAEAYSMVTKPMLPTIPLFTLAGYILAEGGAPRRLVVLFRGVFGWMPGGVAVVAIVMSAFFTCFTGGSGVTILAMGGLMFPLLLADGHRPKFATGLLTAAGSLGLLIPPSVAVILYAIVAEVDIPRLFVAGLIPSALQIVLVAGFTILVTRRFAGQRFKGTTSSFRIGEAAKALWTAKWEASIPFVVIGVMLGGIATLVEAAAITVLYALFIEFVIHREGKTFSDLVRTGANAVTLIGGVLLILGAALGLTNYLIFADIPGMAIDWVQSFVASPLFFLLLLNIFLLIVGCLMDIYSAIVVVVPLVAPLGLAFGIDPLHLGVIFLTNLELGYLTPPVGMNLFLASYRFKRPLGEVYRASVPFLLIRAGAVLLVTYIPYLTLALPGLFFD
ncbi:MAG: TRAP transporter large permease subunit [Acidobacteria bacterium]|nr:TRAP transporter large permease subunit [Acidobacteriota bacterium]MYG74441.1 TRAP transporter large permease subunit [Acidobacteriota bacterium]